MSDAIIDKDSENKPLEPAQPHPIETVIEMPQNQYAHVPQNVPREPLISTKITNMKGDKNENKQGNKEVPEDNDQVLQAGCAKSSKDSKDSDRKRDKLIKRMYNLMTKDQTLSCLLLSLLDSDCLNKLIRTRSDELIEPPKQDPSNQPNTPNQSNLRNLFYRSEHQHTNYRFVYHNHTIKVDKVEPSEELKANNYEYENTNFSELKEGKYHLEKGSMIWKFRMEELEKVSMNSKRSDAESELRNNLLKDLDEKEPKDLDAELMIKNLKKILSKWKSDDMSLEKIKIDLENYFLKKIKQINKKGSFDEGIKQSLVEKVIDPIQEKIIKYLNEDGYLRRFVIELQNDAKDIIKTIGGIFKEKHIEDLRKLKDDYYDENKRVVSELLKIRDLIKRSYIIEINKIIETNPDKDKRNEKINDLEKKFIKEIEVTKIKLFVKKLLIKTKRSEKDFSTNVELLTDDEIECILESMIEEVEHYNGITLNKTNDGIKELVKKIDKQKERNTNEHEGVPRDHIDQIEQNFDIKELVKNLTKIIIKIGIIVNKPKPNRFGNLFQTTSQLKEYIEGNKFEDLKEENLSNINEKFNKFEILIEKLVKDYTKEIDKIESNKSGKNILEDILAGERANGIIIDKVEKAMIKESAKMFIEENVKIRINRAKETFIKSIETASEEQQESQKSKIKESVNKFIEFVEELDKIEDINEIEEEVKNFITNNFIEENATTDGTEENNLKNATEIKNSVDEFIKWVNKKERITKFKKLENLIREIGITEIEKLGEDSIKPADDFIDHIETKIEELESDSKPEDIINNIRKFKIEKLANINEHERNEIINNIVICKINDELVKDSTERISTFKKLENENSEWRKELKENFIKRKNKIEELAVDPKKFEFQITDSLKADRDLVRLFCDLNEETKYQKGPKDDRQPKS
ncbi:11702_t:CDS:2 [Rhizophagus irregularis]|nr:11702_t:CDS:2 [Rhizophagus irregularis]